MYDVAIIGAGVVGAALAYELAQYKLTVLLLEKENDVAMGATRANTAILHAGYDPQPGSLMAKLNVRGTRRCFELCQTLDVEHKRCGSLVVALAPEEVPLLEELYRNGLANGVSEQKLLSKAEALALEPNLNPSLEAALWEGASGVINPWEFGLALAEVAVRNGVELRLNQEVQGLAALPADCWQITTQDQQYEARFLVAAAGVHAAQVHELYRPAPYQIQATRGEYYLLDQNCGELVQRVIFPCPTPAGKGALVAPTIHGNILVGPNAELIADLTDCSTSRSGLTQVAQMARRSVPSIDFSCSIRNYAGVRANSSVPDFQVDFVAPHFLELACIRSPGLSAAPALAEYALALLGQAGLALQARPDFQGERRQIRFKHLTNAAKRALLRSRPLFGRVICRCESITEGEIVAACHSPIPPVSLDGIKRRAGSGMGRCQGGFCAPLVLKILARERGWEPSAVCQDAAGSWILLPQELGGLAAGDSREQGDQA